MKPEGTFKGSPAWRPLPQAHTPWCAIFRRGLILFAVVATLGGCTEAPKFFGERLNISDPKHRIGHPSKDEALATGKGCSLNKADAMKSARRVAEFNLRSLTGSARYRVEYEKTGEWKQNQKTCIEVSAQAIPW